jgi:hypothetical protein
MPEAIEQFWNFDNADLGANRMGQLSEKQKTYLTGEHKSQRNVFLGVGGVASAIIAIAFCILPALLIGGRVILPMALGGDFSDMQELVPFAAAGGIGIVAVISAFIPIVAIMGIYFARANKKADLFVKSAEGRVNYSWGTKRVRNPGNKARPYDDVRILHLSLGEKKFEVHKDLQEIIKEGENWIVYYTSYPFKFLSAEQVK